MRGAAMLEGMERDEMRAGDAEREAVADQLRTALAEGRLDLHEFDERLQQVYTAKRYGELAPVLADLPAAAVPAPVDAAPVLPAGRELTVRWLTELWSSWVSVVGITVVIWLVSAVASGALPYFWPVWVAGPWGAVLVWQSAAGLVSGEPRKQAEKRARKQAKKERRQAERELDGEQNDR